jgi:large subunit ribosomal protein L28
MARKCDFCGKGVFTGNNVSHSNIKTRARWLPNLKKIKAVVAGIPQTARACTRCIRSGKIARPVKRTWKPDGKTEATAKA